jgi:hypothetical protein
VTEPHAVRRLPVALGLAAEPPPGRPVSACTGQELRFLGPFVRAAVEDDVARRVWHPYRVGAERPTSIAWGLHHVYQHAA